MQKIKVQEMTVPEDVGFGTRVETGPVEFTYPNGKQDRPGIFLRCDDCWILQTEIAKLENCLRFETSSRPLELLKNIKSIIGNEWRE